jgi:hypothetical protein
MAMAATTPDDQMTEFARTSPSRPTTAVSAPHAAASNHTNAVHTTNVTTSTWAVLPAPAAYASGTDSRAAADTRSEHTMSRLRLTRSASAPANSPKQR